MYICILYISAYLLMNSYLSNNWTMPSFTKFYLPKSSFIIHETLKALLFFNCLLNILLIKTDITSLKEA